MRNEGSPDSMGVTERWCLWFYWLEEWHCFPHPVVLANPSKTTMEKNRFPLFNSLQLSHMDWSMYLLFRIHWFRVRVRVRVRVIGLRLGLFCWGWTVFLPFFTALLNVEPRRESHALLVALLLENQPSLQIGGKWFQPRWVTYYQGLLLHNLTSFVSLL